MSPGVTTSFTMQYTLTLFQRIKKYLKSEKDPITQETGKKVLKGLLDDNYYDRYHWQIF